MCPSYRATGEEQHSTRGRAHLLWEMLAGALREEGFQSDAVHEALDLCLSCKACKSECPVQVDMAAYKSEFLAQHYKGRLHPLQHYIFGFADRLARYGSLAPALTNALLTGPLTSPLVKRIAGVAQERQLAPPGSEKLSKNARNSCSVPARLPRREAQFAWTGQSCSGPTPGTTTTTRRRSLPPKPSSPKPVSGRSPAGHICCGRPLYDFGLLGAARSYLADVLDRMARRSRPACPSSSSSQAAPASSKTSLLELFPNDPRAKRLSDKSGCWPTGSPPTRAGLCRWPSRRRAHPGPRPLPPQGGLRRPGQRNRAARKAGATVEPIQAGCCGMAGPFGFEAGKFEVSKTIANQGLLPAVQSAGPVHDPRRRRLQLPRADRAAVQPQALHFAEVLAHNSTTRWMTPRRCGASNGKSGAVSAYGSHAIAAFRNGDRRNFSGL